MVSKDFKFGNQSIRLMPRELVKSAEASRSVRDTGRRVYNVTCEWGHVQAKCLKRKELVHNKGISDNLVQVEPGIHSLGTCLFPEA